MREKIRPPFESGAEPVIVVDLFAGCGGMSLGLAQAAWRSGRGFRGRLAIDLDDEACAVYRSNFPGAEVVTGDVEAYLEKFAVELPFERRAGHRLQVPKEETSEVDRKRTDFLIGGPPCQGHSDLNNHSRRSDPRNRLYLAMVRAAAALQPRAVIIENVPAVRNSFESVVSTAKEQLGQSGLGYSVCDGIVTVSRMGVPQKRKRHILLALSDGLDSEAIFQRVTEQATPERSVRWAISDLEKKEGLTPFDTPSKPSSVNLARMKWFFKDPEHRFELPDALRPPCHRDRDHSYRSVYGRLSWDSQAQTITTGFGSMGQGRYVHPGQPRTLTPHEAARLQSFPDFFSFDAVQNRSAWARLIGNAVPPPLSEAFAFAILENWRQGESTASDAARASR